MAKTKNLSREQLLTSFLHRACDLSSSGLQIDSEGYLYASGEMIAAWRKLDTTISFPWYVLFIDCGSKFVCNRRVTNDLKELAEKEGIVFVTYNGHSYAITQEFQFVERMVSYPIWTTPERVNPKNIFQQCLKTLDKAIEKAISYRSIQILVKDTQRIATLFGFTFDASRYAAQATQGAQLERAKKERLAQHHLQQYQRIIQELEAS
jgi:hypothetical protein